jgi:mannose-6-phosphate isomerase
LKRAVPADRPTAESWEIAAHANGTTNVANGRYAGRSLAWLLSELGEALVGRRARWALDRDRFPLLVKLLDAADDLSVQVHPDDAYAMTHEGNELGKSEMWVVLHAKPGAAVVLGLVPGVTRESIRAAIYGGDLVPLLHYIPLSAGDHICVPAGSLHAILSGVLMAEIQQNSDTTYRVYDWNRLGTDGLPRSLHIEKALDVINYQQITPARPTAQPVRDSAGRVRERLCATDYFVVERVRLTEGEMISGVCGGETLEIWGVVEGSAQLEANGRALELHTVKFVLLPAMLGAYQLLAVDGPATFLHVYLP